MDLYRADQYVVADDAEGAEPKDLCLDRYPRDLRNALMQAEAGHVHAGHGILVQGLRYARQLRHPALERVYEEALAVYETRYAMAAN